MKHNIPVRIVRAATLRSIRTEAQEANDAAKLYSGEANQWRAGYVEELNRAKTAERNAQHAEETIAQLRRLLAELAAELEGAYALHRQLRDERDNARAERDDGRAELIATLRELFTAASDPSTGSEFRGRLALGVLRKMLADQLDDEDSPSVLLLAALLFRDDEDTEENALEETRK